jgi:hypothetical protein
LPSSLPCSSIRNSTHAPLDHDYTFFIPYCSLSLSFISFTFFPTCIFIQWWSYFKSTYKKKCNVNVEKSRIENPLLTRMQIVERVKKKLFWLSRDQTKIGFYAQQTKTLTFILKMKRICYILFQKIRAPSSPRLDLHVIFHISFLIILSLPFNRIQLIKITQRKIR